MCSRPSHGSAPRVWPFAGASFACAKGVALHDTRDCSVSVWEDASARTRTEATDGSARRAANGDTAQHDTSESVPEHISRPAHFLLVKARRLAVSGTIFVALILVVLAVGRIAQTIDYNALVHVLKHFRPATVAWSILATSISFAALIGRDVSAVRYVGAKVPWLAPTVAGFCGTALVVLSQNVTS